MSVSISGCPQHSKLTHTKVRKELGRLKSQKEADAPEPNWGKTREGGSREEPSARERSRLANFIQVLQEAIGQFGSEEQHELIHFFKSQLCFGGAWIMRSKVWNNKDYCVSKCVINTASYWPKSSFFFFLDTWPHLQPCLVLLIGI